MKKNYKKKVIKLRLTDVIIVFSIIALISFLIVKLNSIKSKNTHFEITPEIARSRQYDTVQPGEEKTNSEFVEFDAFFLKDLDGDGNADSIRGTCNKVGKEDTLYMEIKVLNDGYLKNGVITINSDNFFLNTNIIKDSIVSKNYVSDNTKKIELNNLQNGIQKIITGTVKSGIYDNPLEKTTAIGNDTNKYSKINSVTITGTHVSDAGKETKINKTINFNVDWYGITTSQFEKSKIVNNVENIDDLIDGQDINLSFEVTTRENENDLLLKGNYLEGTIPALNGYMPKSVEIKGADIEYTYDNETGHFTIKREAILNEKGLVTRTAQMSQTNKTRYNTYSFYLVYPKEAYDSIENTSIELYIPLKTWYEGYNNSNSEFNNPYISNISEKTLSVRWLKYQGFIYSFDIEVGKYSKTAYSGYAISKEKPIRIYNNISNSETEDYYDVKWILETGNEQNADKVVMKETPNGNSEKNKDEFIKLDSYNIPMEDLTSNVGIYFTGQESLLGDNGWIKIYNDETNELIETFTKSNWSTYNDTNPYMYSEPIKHIRIETSEASKNSKFIVNNIKELDDAYITSNFTKDEFDKLQYIQSTLTGYYGNDKATVRNRADYQAPYSIATINVSDNNFSTQKGSQNLAFTISTKDSNYNTQNWKNGLFLIKMPNEIIDMNVKNVKIFSENDNTKILGYELYEENQCYFLKILTENETEEKYTISVSCDITPDPKAATLTRSIELYAINEQACEYDKNHKSEDIYDIDQDNNIKETVNKDSTNINIIAPNSLLTYQIASNYDKKNNITVAPKVAKTDKDQRTANVEISVTNNYSQNITDIIVQGVIPFEGNKYIIGSEDLNSEFTTWLSNTGISVPDELKDIVKVYYSTEENPSNNIKDENNKWKLSEYVEDWTKIKTYIIDFGNYEMEHGQNYTFTYQINIPEGLNYNDISYSEHAIYFSLLTDQGKYSTFTSPSKLGFMIAKQYDLEITKLQQDTDKLLSGINLSICEEGKNEGQAKITDLQGNAKFTGLFAEKTYILKEIKTTADYKLNEEEIKIYTYTDEQDILHIAYKEENGTYTNLTDKYNWVKSAEALKQDSEEYEVKVSLENEVKPKLKLIKVDSNSGEKLSNVVFNIKGEGTDASKFTDSNGEITISGLYLDKEYEITETRKQGYYQMSPVKFKILNNNGTYSVKITEGSVKEQSIETVDSIPQITLTLENEQIPTYNLQITKIEEKHDDKKLKNTEFMLTGEDDNSRKKLTTNENGTATLENLYQFVHGQDITGKYTLVETKAPNGYSNNREEIKFVVTKNGDNLEVSIENKDNLTSIKSAQIDGNTLKLTIQDKPLFKLTKTDEDTKEPIANAKFIIYELDDNGNEIDFAKDINDNYVGTLNNKNQYEIITDENGEVTIPLKNGTYKATEIEAPPVYKKSPKEEIFKISGNEENQDVGTPDEYTNTLEINYIEDLVDLSENVKNGNTYSGTKVILKRTLDFTDNSSYKDPSNTTTYGDYNLDGNTEDIKTELTTGIGFRGIGTSTDYSHVFSGIFDGQNNEINGIHINYKASAPANTGDNKLLFAQAALFSNVKNGKIKRLTIGGEIQGNSGTSGLVSCADNIEIYNCVNNCNIKVSSDRAAGILSSGRTNVIIEGCKNNGNIENSYMSGTILDYTHDDTEKVIIKSCENTADLDLNYMSGSLFGSITAKNILVDNCKNYGNITVSRSSNFIGGLGYSFSGTHNETCVISNCINYGNIYASSDYVGGIVYQAPKKIYNCINYGNIYCPKKGYIVGGLVGTAYNNELVENCINYGNIRANSGYYISGIFGNGAANISNCANYGDLQGENYINGIAYASNSSNAINNCYNRGDLYCLQSNVGGISSYTSNTIKNSYTTGKIHNISSNENGKIYNVYSVGPNNSEITNSYYLYGVDDINASEKFNTGTQVTEEQLGSREFFDTLNSDDVWIYREGEPPVLKMPATNAKETSELNFTNKMKEFKITTDVKEIDGVKGGNISGENETPYESVKYNQNSIKEIKIEPDEGYSILSLTINGKNYEFEPESDGTYTLPLFQKMLEDKTIVVSFGKNNEFFTINKVDAETNESIKGAEFEIAPKGQEIITSLYGNNQYYFSSNYDSETSKYTYTSNNRPSGVQNSTANSLIYLNPSLSQNARYKVVINASISSEENNDIGWATLRNNGPSYDNTNGRFIYISGEKQEQDYESEIFEFTGNEAWYISLGYSKNESIDYGQDSFKINSVKLLNVDTNEDTDITSKISIYNQYDFKLYNGSYIPTNGKEYRHYNNTYAHSSIYLARSNYNGTYYIEVEASISSEEGKDLGYATISKNITSERGNNDTIIEFMNISGEVGKKIYKSGPIVFDDSSQNRFNRYVNFVYSKDESNSSGNDEFVIYSIKICKYDELQKVTTDSNGKANIVLSQEKSYTIDEIEAPEGYLPNNERIEFNPSTSNSNIITIQNSKMPNILVNHFLWTEENGTTTRKVANSSTKKGKLNEVYSTNPKFNIEYEIVTNKDYYGNLANASQVETETGKTLEELGYKEITDESDENYGKTPLEQFLQDFYIPQNSNGVFTEDTQVINYYYKEKTYTLTVKHLLEGTEESMPSKTGGIVEDEVTEGYEENEEYSTSKSNKIDYDKYELVEVPENAEGTITENTEVRYYYRQKEHKITTKVKEHEETNSLGVTISVKGGSITGEEEKPYETVKHNEDSTKEIKAVPEENYVVKSIKINGEPIEFTAEEDRTVTLSKFVNMTEDKEVIVEFQKIQGTVIVHHYIEGTTTPIDLKDRTKAEDEVKTGSIGDIYATKPNENAMAKYSVVNNTPERASGTYIDGTIEVIYYYQEQQVSVTVTKEWSDNNNRLGIRPSSVKVNLKASIINDSSEAEDVTDIVIPAEIEKQVTLSNSTGTSNGNNWTYTWENLKEYTADSKQIVYTVEEEPLEANLAVVYSSTIKKDTSNPYKITITNTYTEPTEKINYVVNKIWDDNSNANSKRPEELVFNIYKAGANNTKTQVATYTINTLSETSHTFELDKYDEKGNEINYGAEEKEKTPNDLYFYTKTGGERQEITLNENKAYKSEFTNKFEVPQEKVNIEVTKKWEDESDISEKRPESIKLVLYKLEQEGTGSTATSRNVKVTEYTLNTPSNSNSFSYIFENQPKYDEHGNEIKYVVDEEAVNENDLEFYSKEIKETGENKYKITNTFTVPEDKIEIEAEKIWVEQNDIQKQKRPSSVILKLMNGTTEVGESAVNEGVNWKTTFTNLARYDTRGNKINYTLAEEEVVEGDLQFYTQTGSSRLTKVDDTHYKLTYTNTFKEPDETIELKVTKTWEDGNGKDRLNAIKLVLTGDGQTYEKKLTKSNEDKTNSNNWVYTFTNLPKYNSNGEEIQYTLTEQEVNRGDLKGYITKVEGYTVTNKLIAKETKIEKTGTEEITSLDTTVNYTIKYEAKVDSEYTENSKITIIDNLPYEIDTTKQYELSGGTYNAENKTITWEDQKTPENGKIEITKQIALVYKDLPLNIDKFTNKVKGILELTNGIKEEKLATFDTVVNFKRNITVTKVWKGDSQSNIRPENIQIKLLKNGAIEKKEVINAKVNWKVLFKDLEKYDKTTREEITYTVEEENVPKEYYAEIIKGSNQGENNLEFKIINSKYGSVKIIKIDKIDSTKKLGGAEFTLIKLKEENGKWVEDSNFEKRVQVTSDKLETLGTAEFKDLVYGKYRLKETKAPQGYENLKEAVDIDINETNVNVQTKIQNKEKNALPATGGVTKVAIIMLGVVSLFIAYKLKKKH